jgi:uncharacterized repeat protein (TIGR03803 family)
MTPSGAVATLYSFCSESGCTDGEDPEGLVQATDGDLYGTTYLGGPNGGGTVFKITLGGVLTTLHSFCAQSGCTDGTHPYSVLVQDTNGSFYGTTFRGGANGWGMAFSLSVGLGPFVETQPTSGSVGTVVTILGNNLTGTTGVGFNGAPATFSVVSDTEIQTIVPARATTGIVQVTTPGGVLNSNVAFQVAPLANTPQTQIVNLQNTVTSLVSDGTLNPGLGQFLLSPLDGALDDLDPAPAALADLDGGHAAAARTGHARAAIQELEEFIGRVQLLVILRRLKPAEGRILIDAAESIIRVLRV